MKIKPRELTKSIFLNLLVLILDRLYRGSLPLGDFRKFSG